MRTNIDIDDKLMQEAMSLTGQTTKKGAVEEALKHLIRLEEQRKSLYKLREIGWDGDLEEIRSRWPTEDLK
jgi:Arc/MetJ family transcription regulator